MAKSKQAKGTESAATIREGFRTFSADGSGFYELKENESLEGIYLGRRQQTIKDRRTKANKDVWVYRIRTEDDKVVKLGGRALLDSQFDDIIDEMFGGSEDGMKGVRMVINRGANKETSGGDPMGTYEILVEDPDQVKD